MFFRFLIRGWPGSPTVSLRVGEQVISSCSPASAPPVPCPGTINGDGLFLGASSSTDFVDAWEEDESIQVCCCSFDNRHWVSAVTLGVSTFTEADEQQTAVHG
jgi:hypothetical protein